MSRRKSADYKRDIGVDPRFGSELVQKFIGEGAKLVKDIFALARRGSVIN